MGDVGADAMPPSKKSPKVKNPDVQEADAETRLVVLIPERVHRRLKARAAEEGKSIKEYLLDVLREKGIS
jgi:predicted HicB family RNase H-like nuclease